MPGLRYGNDITDTAQQMRDISVRLRSQLSAPNLSKQKRGALDNALRANERAIRETFGSTRTMQAFARYSAKDMPDVTGPDGQKFRPALPKHLHRRAKQIGVSYERKGTRTLVGKTDADSYSARGSGNPTIEGSLAAVRQAKRAADNTAGRKRRRAAAKAKKATRPKKA